MKNTIGSCIPCSAHPQTYTKHLETWGHLVAWQIVSHPGCPPFWKGSSDSQPAADSMGPSPGWPITAAHGQAHCARSQAQRRVQVGECQCQECALRPITEREAGHTAREKAMLNLHQSLLPLLSSFPSHTSCFPPLHPVLLCHLVLRGSGNSTLVPRDRSLPREVRAVSHLLWEMLSQMLRRWGLLLCVKHKLH